MIYRKEDIVDLNNRLDGKTAQEIIAFFVESMGEKITFGTSMGAEDQVVTQMLMELDKEVSIFTLDTARLFPETYELIDRTNKKYGIKIDVFFPDYKEVEQMVAENGINLFFDSVDNRHLCCQIRKLNPLKRALQGKEAWFTGLRRSQSVTRVDMQVVEWDENSGMLKVNPLIDWSEDDVWEYIEKQGIPFNPLHKKGYPSIGCQPCTRAIMEGEDVRAGRWWWENPDSRECGLHKK
ncbi:MAG: phosphoadenylyl-sulfate reductase [Bacteroidetes bacterium]|nr:MAG: phosphoadenylyl-sulfate reductase [Bacteroidota bacterium]